VTEVLCLPLYGTLDLTTVQTIGELIAAEQRIATR
jgi:hypothetical protein